MSEAPEKQKTLLSDKRLEQLAAAREKAALAKKRNAALREEKRIQLAKDRILEEQGLQKVTVSPIGSSMSMGMKDPEYKQQKWNQRKAEILDAVQLRINELGLVSRKDAPKLRKKNVKQKARLQSPISDTESSSDSETDESEEEVRRPTKKSKVMVKKKPVKMQEEELIRLY